MSKHKKYAIPVTIRETVESLSFSKPPSAARQYAIYAAIFIAFVGFLIFLSSNNSGSSSSHATDAGGAIPVANAQMVEISAKVGYSPKSQTAKANMPTTLRVNTNSTYDCSSSLNIPSLGIRKFLPPTGSTDINVPPQAPGTTLKGTCGMGMYKFDVNFQ